MCESRKNRRARAAASVMELDGVMNAIVAVTKPAEKNEIYAVLPFADTKLSPECIQAHLKRETVGQLANG